MAETVGAEMGESLHRWWGTSGRECLDGDVETPTEKKEKEDRDPAKEAEKVREEKEADARDDANERKEVKVVKEDFQ